MNTPKHTPGPWFPNGPWHIQAKSPHQDSLPVIVGQVVKGHHIDQEQQEANALLLAAAPDLLYAAKLAMEIIKTARQYFPKSFTHRDKFALENTCATIGAAIAKAEGRL
jgi:hypothetical protein